MSLEFNLHNLEDLISDESFQRWSKNTSDDEETQFWEKSYQKYPEHQDTIDQAKQTVRMLSRSEPHVDPESINKSWTELEDRIDGSQMKRVKFPIWYRYAAVLALTILASIFMIDQMGIFEDHISYHANYGEKRTIDLPDGTVVTLNANSTIHISANWDDSNRKVWLDEGEAFFHVQKTDDRQSFQVYARDIEIKVLGTKFNVNQRTAKLKILLTEGKINLKSKIDSRELKPGDLAIYDGSQISIQQVNVAKYDSWLRNKIVFDNTRLSEVAEIMQTHYGVNVDVDSSLEDRMITGEIPNDNLKLLLKAISVSLGVRTSHSKDNVIISKNE